MESYEKAAQEVPFAAICERINWIREGTVNIHSTEGEELYNELQSEIRQMSDEELNIKKVSLEVLYWWIVTIRNINYDEFIERYSVHVTVSLTSYPDRIKYVPIVIQSMITQSKRPDQILLYLADSQFPAREGDLDIELRELIDSGKCQVKWCEDLKSHKKYFYSFQEIKQGVIVTIDDDLEFINDLIELLLLSYVRHPHAISAVRAHLIAIDESENILPYQYWIPETDYLMDTPCMQLMATGGAGALYPQGIFSNTLFDMNGILETCVHADDLWLKCHEIMDGIPTVVACRKKGLHCLDNSQSTALWNYNRGENDRQLQQIIQYMERRLSINIKEKILEAREGVSIPQIGIVAYSHHACHYIEKLKANNNALNREKMKMVNENRCLKKKEEELLNEKKRILKERESDRELIRELSQENSNLKNDIKAVKGSVSYRLGNVIIRPIHMVKAVLNFRASSTAMRGRKC